MRLKELTIKDFKGIKDQHIAFGDITNISGANATGKTSVFDAYTWLLFDKDSTGNSKFEVRELDNFGNKVHHTEIFVEALIDVDGTEYTLSKTQKEKWVKKRGQEEQEYAGNTNEYMINGYPKSQKEYAAFINEIVDEKTFRILSSPMVFPSMDWKEQRSILFDLVGDVGEISEADADYFELIKPELAVASIDDIRKKYAKAKSELKKKPDEIQTRIDEISKQLADESELDDLNKRKFALENEIDLLEAEQIDLNNRNSDVNARIEALTVKQTMLRASLFEDSQKEIRECESVISELWTRISQLDVSTRVFSKETQDAERQIEEIKSSLAKAEETPVSLEKENCPTCGQVLPEKMQEEIHARHERERAENIQNLQQHLNRCEADLLKKIRENDRDLRTLEELRAELQTEKDKLDGLKKKNSWAGHNEEIDALEKQIAELKAGRDDEETKSRKSVITGSIMLKQAELVDIKTRLNTIYGNKAIRERIASLKAEMKEVAAKLSTCDKYLYALDSYTKAIARKINEQFTDLEFKLFEEQINGGVKETCEITLNGVPFSDLNSGHKIVIGLEIIKVLSNHFNKSVPVWIDNAESVNSFNIPDMDGQRILLSVSESKKLVIG